MIELCGICNTMKNDTIHAIVEQKYYSHVCKNCLQHGKEKPIDAAFERSQGHIENAKEIIQPLNRDGSINPDFAEAYPQQSESLFGKDKLQDF